MMVQEALARFRIVPLISIPLVNVMLTIIRVRWRDVQPRFGPSQPFCKDLNVGLPRIRVITVVLNLLSASLNFVVHAARFTLETVGGFSRFPSWKVVIKRVAPQESLRKP
mgnify:CR=1 FL=1